MAKASPPKPQISIVFMNSVNIKRRKIMKKILSLIFCVVLSFSALAGCAPKKVTGQSSQITSDESADFTKPESFASVVLVTINPQFRLYLDTEGVVLAVEPVNDDAKTIENKVEFKNKKVEAVVQNLVTVANDSGFIKENATIDVKISSNNNQEDSKLRTVLTAVKASVTAKLTELKIKAEVTTSVLKEEKVESTASTNSTSSDTTSTASSNIGSPAVSSKPTASDASQMPVCKHTNKRAESINTGKNIIDTSKLDVINHSVVCADCNEAIGLEAHKLDDSKCTLCGQNNFKMKTTGVVVPAPTLRGDLKINNDGSPAFEVMIDITWRNAITPEYTVDEFNYKIPEAAILKEIREKFVISDAQFEKLKAQGEYEFFISTHTYKDGYFNICYPAAGGGGEYSHKQLGYTDNKAGVFTVYFDYMREDYDSDKQEHISYYAVEYSYSGYSNLSIMKGEWYNSILGFESVVDSMRVTSIKNVSSIPANITKI